MTSRLLARLRSETGLALIRTFLAKGAAAFGALGLVVVLGQLYGPEGVGVYALAHSILLGAGILSRRGMDNALMRFVGRDFESPAARQYLYWAGTRSLWLSFPLMLFVMLGRSMVGDFFDMPALADVLVGVGLAIPLFSWSFILAGFFKGIRKPATAALQEGGAISLVAGALMLVLYLFGSGDPVPLSWFGWMYFLAVLFVAGKGQLTVMVWLHRRAGDNKLLTSEESTLDLPAFREASQSLFVMSLATFMQSVLSIMIAGKFLGSVELGLFKSAQQVGMSVAFVLIVINAIFPVRFAELYYQSEMAKLEGMARRSALLGLLLASPFIAICLLAPGWILGLIGEGFGSAAPLLRIIAVAQLVNVATGSVAFMLNMTGHDKVMRNIALLCNGLGLMVFLLFTLWQGALGAAYGLAFVMVAQNLIALALVWIKLGIWTMPGPNLLAWLGVKSQAVS